jgi:pimeloyl-ACP methyl ester carboxylesterase
MPPCLVAAVVVSLCGLASPLTAQRIVERYDQVGGFLRIGPGPDRKIPMTERGHTLIMPEVASAIRGVVVFVDPRRFASASFAPKAGELEGEALARSVAVLHITTGNPLDFLFGERDVRDLADRVRRVLEENDLDGAPVFLAGLSLGGTRALRLAEFLCEHGDGRRVRVAAVAIVDAPLDMVRFWDAERRAAELGFHPAAADEGRWVTYLLETHLGGTPARARSRYVRYSPFVYSAKGGGNAVYLRDLPIRAYDEPDVNWWIENRRKSYYSMNSLDQAALIDQLRIFGNERAELVSSHGRRQGYAEGASPHTWSIVDNAELIEWFLAQAADSPRFGGAP